MCFPLKFWDIMKINAIRLATPLEWLYVMVVFIYELPAIKTNKTIKGQTTEWSIKT